MLPKKSCSSPTMHADVGGLHLNMGTSYKKPVHIEYFVLVMHTPLPSPDFFLGCGMRKRWLDLAAMWVMPRRTSPAAKELLQT